MFCIRITEIDDGMFHNIVSGDISFIVLLLHLSTCLTQSCHASEKMLATPLWVSLSTFVILEKLFLLAKYDFTWAQINLIRGEMYHLMILFVSNCVSCMIFPLNYNFLLRGGVLLSSGKKYEECCALRAKSLYLPFGYCWLVYNPVNWMNDGMW